MYDVRCGSLAMPRSLNGLSSTQIVSDVNRDPSLKLWLLTPPPSVFCIHGIRDFDALGHWPSFPLSVGEWF